MKNNKFLKLSLTLLVAVIVSACNSSNSTASAGTAPQNSQLQTYINSLTYTAATVKQLSGPPAGSQQQSFTTPGDLIINSININFYSGANCGGSLVSSKTLNGNPDNPVMPLAGSYSSNNTSNNELCSSYVNGVHIGCAGLYADMESGGMRSMQFVYNLDDGVSGAYEIVAPCMYNQAAMLGSTTGVEGVANWSSDTVSVACSGSGASACGFSQAYHVTLTPPVQYVAVGTGGTILHSVDGITWESTTVGSQYFNGVTYGNAYFVAVGEAGIIYNSNDGITWDSQTSGTIEELFKIVYGNSLFVTVGCNGTILSSPNSIDWTTQASATGCNVYGITYGNGLYVATGENGIIQTSANAITWSLQPSYTTNELTGVTYGNDKYVAVGVGGTIVYSSDGTSWTLATSGITAQLGEVTYGAGLFVAVARDGEIITSPDAITWTSRVSPTVNPLYGITFKDKFVAVGNNGTILNSLDGITWTLQSSPTTENLWDVTYRNNN